MCCEENKVDATIESDCPGSSTIGLSVRRPLQGDGIKLKPQRNDEMTERNKMCIVHGKEMTFICPKNIKKSSMTKTNSV